MIALAHRSQNALMLAATAQTWTRLSAQTFRIPSQSTPGQTYLTTPQTCSCKAAERHPYRLCKHSLSVAIVAVLLDMDTPPAAPKPLSDADVTALFARFEGD